MGRKQQYEKAKLKLNLFLQKHGNRPLFPSTKADHKLAQRLCILEQAVADALSVVAKYPSDEPCCERETMTQQERFERAEAKLNAFRAKHGNRHIFPSNKYEMRLAERYTQLQDAVAKEFWTVEMNDAYEDMDRMCPVCKCTVPADAKHCELCFMRKMVTEPPRAW